VNLFETSLWFYFFLRLKKPAAIEPKPSRPNNGRGEAVWGSFCPEAALSSAEATVVLAAGAALSAVALLAGAAFWSLAVLAAAAF
jgi:hypothetical protein